MRIIKSLPFVLIALLASCENIDDATLSSRRSFIHLYEGPVNFSAADILPIADGFLILGNLTNKDLAQDAFLIRTDLKGNRIGSIEYYRGSSGRVIKPFSNVNFSGYLIFGDSIHIDPNSAQVGNIEITSARLLAIDDELQKRDSISFSDVSNNLVKTDIRGISMTIKEDGGVVILNTFEKSGETQKPWVISMDNALNFEWEYKFNSLTRDYVNGKSIHHFNNSVIWANSLLRQQGSFNEKYVSITKVEDYLSEAGYSLLGESLGKSISATDMQPSKVTGFGFGVIGTISETDGTNNNMFFTRTDGTGELGEVPDTVFIDAFLGETNSSVSEVEDFGISLCSTSDGGYVLAGTMLTTSTGGITIGNGARDILLVKVDVTGNILWQKTIGSAGDEVVACIVETPDKGLAMCGTNTIGGYSTIFLIKTDKNGELKN